jgi:hypothetical protein
VFLCNRISFSYNNCHIIIFILYLTYNQVLLFYLKNSDTALLKGEQSLMLVAVLRDHLGGGAVPRPLRTLVP